MIPKWGQRVIAALVAILVSLGLAVVFMLIALAVEHNHHKEYAEVGIGIGTALVVWPSLLPMCLIFFDGFVTDGITRNVVARSLIWGTVPGPLIWGLVKMGINRIGFADVIGGKGVGTVLAFGMFLTPSLLAALLGIRLRFRTENSS